MPLLEVKGLQVEFQTRRGNVRAVNGVSFCLEKGETLALVGESGSGKSVSAMSILRLLDENGKIVGGQIRFESAEENEPIDLVKISAEHMRKIRGNQISVVFQEPMTALNPVLSIGKQVSEPFLIHRGMGKREALEEAEKMLAAVQIPNPERVIKEYAHTLSGGMRQRVMIAMALACRPKLLIADEPTTALDVTIQAQILKLMKKLQKENGAAILFITHDLGVVNEMADEVAVLYCGQVVEKAKKSAVFGRTAYSHPYTESLLRATPTGLSAGGRLETIKGSVPPLHDLPKGCKFAPRCNYCTRKCIEEEPPLFKTKSGQEIRCFYPKKEERKSDGHRELVVGDRA